MSGGKNKAFKNDPIAFLQANTFVGDDNSFTGGSGVYTVNFKDVGGRILLKKAEGTGTSSKAFSAYYLKAVANDNNVGGNFPNGADIMFTSTIQGCQFLAYGASRAAPTVEHNNWIGTPANYDTRYNTVAAGATHKVRFGNGNGYALDNYHTYNIVGIKQTSGVWNFYVQTSDLTNPGAITTSVAPLLWT